MELNFSKNGNVYVAEFEASSDFNLHVERVGEGSLTVLQSGVSGGMYEQAYSVSRYNGLVFDRDFGALVYPKYIKVVSDNPVTNATVTFA